MHRYSLLRFSCLDFDMLIRISLFFALHYVLQKSMKKLLSHGTILVGHGLNNDLHGMQYALLLYMLI